MLLYYVRNKEDVLDVIQEVDYGSFKNLDPIIIIVESFYGHKKVDTPIEVKGDWRIDFLMEK